MEKVYCGKCQHYLVERTTSACEHESNITIHDTPIKKTILYKKDPEILNKNNDCENFKKEINYFVVYWIMAAVIAIITMFFCWVL